MLTVVTGGSGSGKSEYAEQWFGADTGERKRYYIATMLPYGAEGRRRIEKHRLQRKEKGFITVEWYLNLKEIILEEQSDVLLECMSNLVANEMFEKNGSHQGAEQEILQGVVRLKRSCHELVVVTNEVSSDGREYDNTTREYIQTLNCINQKMAELADRVIEVVASVPQRIK